MPTRRPSLRDTIERNVLCEQWMPLVGWVVQRLRLRRLSLGEAYRAGEDALLRAAELFDPARACERTGRPVRFVTYAVRSIGRAVAVADGKAARRARRTRPLRFGPQGWGDGAHPGDCPEPAAPEPPPGADPAESRALSRALRRLPVRWRELLRLRYEEGLTLVECGERLGVTRERARQLQWRALEKLREAMTGCGA